MTELLEITIEQIRELSPADQDRAAKLLMSFLKHGAAPVQLDDETRAAVREGLAQIERGEVASREEMEAFFRRLGA